MAKSNFEATSSIRIEDEVQDRSAPKVVCGRAGVTKASGELKKPEGARLSLLGMGVLVMVQHSP
jgi:hypothetical protein